jgi:hypothetical protein
MKSGYVQFRKIEKCIIEFYGTFSSRNGWREARFPTGILNVDGDGNGEWGRNPVRLTCRCRTDASVESSSVE